MNPQTQTELNNNVRDYLNREFNSFIKTEKIGCFINSESGLYHNGKPKAIFYCLKCFAINKEDCVCDEDYDGGDDGGAWSGGFADNH